MARKPASSGSLGQTVPKRLDGETKSHSVRPLVHLHATPTLMPRFQNPWDSGASNPFDSVPAADPDPQATSEMLYNAPLPPPVQKAPPPISDPQIGQNGGGMEVDHPMGVA